MSDLFCLRRSCENHKLHLHVHVVHMCALKIWHCTPHTWLLCVNTQITAYKFTPLTEQNEPKG